jgi:hypothetical protein
MRYIFAAATADHILGKPSLTRVGPAVEHSKLAHVASLNSPHGGGVVPGRRWRVLWMSPIFGLGRVGAMAGLFASQYCRNPSFNEFRHRGPVVRVIHEIRRIMR